MTSVVNNMLPSLLGEAISEIMRSFVLKLSSSVVCLKMIIIVRQFYVDTTAILLKSNLWAKYEPLLFYR